MADDLGLLENFLRHEVAMIALVDQHDRSLRLQHRAAHDLAVGIMNLGAAVFQIAHHVGERRKRNGIGADIHRAVAESDRQRRAAPRADQKIVLAGKQESERESAAQPR